MITEPARGRAAAAAWSSCSPRTGCPAAVGLAVYLDAGQPIIGESLVYLLNAGADDVGFALPGIDSAREWECLIDTAEKRQGTIVATGAPYEVRGRSGAALGAGPPRAGKEGS